MNQIPYKQIKTLFLDVGGTLITINYEWVCTELKKLGIFCEVSALQRAEAAARPIVSAQFQEFRQKRGLEIPELFLTKVFNQLPAGIIADERQSADVAHELIPIFFPDRKASDLWNYVLPGIREALEPRIRSALAEGLYEEEINQIIGDIFKEIESKRPEKE